MTHVVAMQMCASMNADENVRFVEAQLQQLKLTESALICLPETCLAFNRHVDENLALARQLDYWLSRYKTLCQNYGVWIVLGSVPVLAQDGRYYAQSMVLNQSGECVGRYNKLHLFDVDVADTTKQYRESNGTAPGEHIEVVNTPFGHLGLSICYDIRFPSLYQTLRSKGANVLLVPSAFTIVTGQAHWHALLKARAIETQSYVIAPAQFGHHANGRETYGHSMIISPWGETLNELETGVGSIGAQLDLNKLNEIRQSMPVAAHNRFSEQLL
ncbi:FIG003879: Predicted amidohydrolase / Omega amidase (Nit2 homolog) [Pseudoalteromonas luteoviolacea B = ATCC 29581]|nr:FIG003879: Predicted amidohydrolase / Omega amidase (Nit2 homolog) [Pseudoalteromonas luteoviolacea B = ATCC 29581]